MFRNRSILLTTPIAEVNRKLNNQKRRMFPHGNITESSFVLYKAVASTYSNRTNRHLFRFNGKYMQNGDKTEINYSVIPCISTIFTSLILVIALFATIYHYLFSNFKALYILILLGLNAINWMLIISQKNTCIQNFEKALTQKNENAS